MTSFLEYLCGLSGNDVTLNICVETLGYEIECNLFKDYMYNPWIYEYINTYLLEHQSSEICLIPPIFRDLISFVGDDMPNDV
jgi:hypothetical protein